MLLRYVLRSIATLVIFGTGCALKVSSKEEDLLASIGITASNAAKSLGWSVSSPTQFTTFNATWTKSSDSKLSNQKIQFYSDANCTTTSGAIIDLNSNTLTSQSLTGSDGDTYTFKVTSINSAGSSTISACSSAIVIDTTAPAASTATAWQEGTLTSSTTIHAQWTKSASSDLSNQKIQFYSDGTCTTPTGGLIDLSSSSTQSQSLSGSGGNSYSFKVTSFDAAGNSSISACSTGITIDTTAPNAATALGWSQSTPYNSTSVTASWTVSNSGDLANQKIQYYSDASCGTSTGSLIDLGSAVTATDAFTGTNGGTYTYKVTSIDQAGNSTVSACSSSMQIDTTAPTVTVNQGASQADPTNSATLTFDVVFSEAIAPATFTTADITQNGTATGITWNIADSGDHIHFTLTTTAITGAGTVIPSIAVNRVQDLAGNNNTASTSTDNSVTYDNTAPSVTGLANDATPTKSKTWTWGCSETCTYRYVIDQVNNTSPGGAYGSTTTDSQTSGNGTYYIHVQAKDAAGNASAVVHYSAILDNTAPTAPSGVTDGTYYNSTTASTTFNWTGSTDANGINHYDVAIGTSAGGTDVVTWTSVGTALTKQFAAGLTLTSGTTYYASVRAVDDAGNISSVASGDGWLVDTTLPAAPTGVSLGAVPGTLDKTPTISWTAATDASGIQQYDVQLHLASDNSVVQAWTTLASGSQLTGLSLTGSTAYYVKIRTVDGAGNVGTSYAQSSNWTTAASCTSGSQTFAYTGSSTTFTVPSGCTTITVKAWGAGGGASSGIKGGGGGYATAAISVTSGESLDVSVGGAGTNSTHAGGSGGGASTVARTGTNLINAAGGGGAGGSCDNLGGAGGAAGGASGTAGADGMAGGLGGAGATAGAGGSGGTGVNANGTSGTAGQGGAGGNANGGGTGGGNAGGFNGGGAAGAGYNNFFNDFCGGGGGGGGCYGGGGGGADNAGHSSAGAGGGGSSCSSGSSVTLTSAVADAAANSGDADYSAGTAKGGTGVASPGNGYIKISW